MGRKGNHRHLTGLATSDFYNVHRKEFEYVLKAGAGRHSSDKSIPLMLAIKKASLAATKREATTVLNETMVMVNGRNVREPKYPIGLGDTIEFKNIGKSFIIGINSNGQCTLEETKADYGAMRFKVVGKYKAKKGAIMLRLHDGSSLKADGKVNVNDSVIIDSSRTLKKTLPLKDGAECIVVEGVHVGSSGKVKLIKKGTMKIPAAVVIAPKSGEQFETTIENIMITD